MKTVMNHSHDGWLLKMISRTDPVINLMTLWDIKAEHLWRVLMLQVWQH